jgi:uncharacterized membrane protein YbhN (UPF0104 family)
MSVGKKLRLGASVALLAFLAWRTDWSQVAGTLRQLHWTRWLLGVGLYAATQVVSSLRWQLLARPLGFGQPLVRFVRLYFVGMFFNLVLPTSVGGDVVRAWYLAETTRRRSAAFVSVLLERSSGLLVLIALACLATLYVPPQLPAWIPRGVWFVTAAAFAGVLTFPLAVRASNRLSRFRPVVETARAYLRRPGLLLGTTLLSVVVQLANVVLVWLLGEALGVSVPALYYGVLVPVVTLLTLLPISLNGMGVREGATIFLLAPFQVTAAQALTLAFAWFATFTAASLAGVVFYLMGHFPRVEVRVDDSAVGDHPDQGRTGQPAAAA